MRGSIRERSKGSWQIQIYTCPGPDGKTRRHFETVHAKKKSDVQPRLNELLSSMDKGVYTPPGRLTVGEHLQQWLSAYSGENGPLVRAKWASRWKWLGGGVGNGFILT